MAIAKEAFMKNVLAQSISKNVKIHSIRKMMTMKVENLYSKAKLLLGKPAQKVTAEKFEHKM